MAGAAYDRGWRIARRAAATIAGLSALGALAASPAAAASAPQIAATWVTNVTATSARLHVRVDPEGLATTLRFEYITEADYQANLSAGRAAFAGASAVPAGLGAPLGSGEAFVESLQSLNSLRPATEYRYRALATNSLETAIGPVRGLLTQESAPTLGLPDDRAWEMVSPVEKDGGAIQGPGQNFGGDVLQAAAQGGAVTYSSSSSFGEGAQGAPAASQYISRRGGSGWSTENVTTPALSGSYGDRPDGVPYQLFSTDLTHGLLLNGVHCRTSGVECPVANPPLPVTQAPPGYQNYYLRNDENGSFTALLTATDAELGLPAKSFSLALAGASPDLTHLVLSTCAALTPGAFEVPEGEGCDSGHPNLYEWSAGVLTQVNFSESEILPTPPARLAAQAGAISANGNRVYFNDPETGNLFLREAGEPVKSVAGSQGEGAVFQAASADGAVAFFSEGETLYRYTTQNEAAEQIATAVQGVLGVSEGGSALYYQTSGGLFRWREGAVTEIAAGAEAAQSSDYPSTTGTARVSADGARLAFLSSASLTGYENLGDSEVYLYNAEGNGGHGELICASCNPSGERPLGPSSIPGAIPNGEGEAATDSYKPRDLVAGGRRLFFDSDDALALQDTDNAPDVYEWEAQGEGSCIKAAGCIGLISSGRSEDGASFLDASESGADAFFLTDGSLVPSDPGSVDVYDAREGGGFPEAVKSLECDADACQPLPAEPEDPTPGTSLQGAGNLPLRTVKPHPKKPHHKKHHRKKRTAKYKTGGRR